MFTFRDFAFLTVGISLGTVVTFRKLEQLHKAELDDILEELNSLLEEKQEQEVIEEEEKYEEKAAKNNYLSFIRENNYKGDEPVDESLLPKVVEYCANDVEVTEAIFYSKGDELNDIVAGGPREDDYHMEERPHPYVVSLEDFINNRTEYDTVTITYYEGDDTLADENEDIIVEVEEVVGRASLLEFGNMSEDPDVVYVRNDMLAMHYEIVRDERTYQEAVLGEV